MSKKHGIGIIGAGAIGGVHAAVINQIGNAELLAVCDTEAGRPAAFAEKHGGKPFDDLDSFLACPGLEIVVIATPSGLHQGAAVAAAKAGKHLIVEKPLEVTVEKCKEIIAAAKQNNVMLSGIFQNRFFDGSMKIRKAVEQGRFGKLVLCDAYVKWHRSQEYYDSAPWRGTKEIDGGGALMNQSIHVIDLLLWLGGDVKEVSSRAATVAHERIEVEDLLVSTLLFENGAMGTVEATTAVWPGSPKRIEILGTRGSVIMEEENITQWSFMDEMPEDEEIRRQMAGGPGAGGASDPMGISTAGHKRQIEDCLKALESGGRPLVDGEAAAKAVALVSAMYESAATGKAVRL
ncbi:MAG: Gfo/Idh/MocA family oxidoreductase [Spirochaetes bacterium]|nr:Gfo/Idh/MocA family oxidoreductase [Spirochaetota bacterium]